EIDPELVVPNPEMTLREGPFDASGWSMWQEGGYYRQLVQAVAKDAGIDLDTPWNELPQADRDKILYGTGNRRLPVTYRNREGHLRRYQARYEGIVGNLQRRYNETNSEYVRSEIENYMSERPCPECGGKRLRPEARAVTVGDLAIFEVTAKPVNQLIEWLDRLEGYNGYEPVLTERQLAIAGQVLKEIRSRLEFMVNVGLDYLTLSRAAGTLSGGEAQRIRLATQIGSRLMGVLYVLDEPSIGLHQRDNMRLIQTLESMRDLGNTLLVVEHDEETMMRADWIIDLGPGAGEHGGQVVAEGTPAEIMQNPNSLTGAYLSGRQSIPTPPDRREGNGHHLTVLGARENNLQDVSVSIPLGKLVVITG